MMSERKPVKLIVSDIDNTISDYFNNWGLAWDKGIEALAASRGMEKDALYADIRENADGYARFHNFPDLLKETPSLSLEGKSPEERARLEKAMLRFAMMWLNSTTAAINVRRRCRHGPQGQSRRRSVCFIYGFSGFRRDCPYGGHEFPD